MLRAALAFAVLTVAASPLFAESAASLRRSPTVIAVQKAYPAVVGVRTHILVHAQRSIDPFSWFFQDFGETPEQEAISQGSGVIIDSRGYILTNYHVIAGGDAIQVELSDDTDLPAEVVGAAPDRDLAVLRVHAKHPLPHIRMGTSHDLMMGETVIAIGSPFGLTFSVTKGVVSALHRTIHSRERTYADFIQTDASINPGNSGGPLLTIDGALVGINTAIYSKAQGIGFAIPIDKAKRIVDDLLRYGEVRPPYFGFDVQALSPDLAQSLGVSTNGALVSQVDPDGPAHGILQPGDVITMVDGAHVQGKDDAWAKLGDYTAGAQVPVVIVHHGQKQQLTLRAGNLAPKRAIDLAWRKIGIRVVALPRFRANQLQLPAGSIVVSEVRRGSAAERYGLQRGDWVRRINSEKARGLVAFGKALARSYWRGEATLLIQRGGVWQQIPFAF